MKTIWQHLENILKTSENILITPENKLKTPWGHLEDVVRTSVNTQEPQNLDLNSASKSWQNFSIKSWPTSSCPSAQLQNLGQTVVNTFLSKNISDTNNIKKFWVGIFKSQSRAHISHYRHYWRWSTFCKRVRFLHRERKILANFGNFVAILRTFWCTFTMRWCTKVDKYQVRSRWYWWYCF